MFFSHGVEGATENVDSTLLHKSHLNEAEVEEHSRLSHSSAP